MKYALLALCFLMATPSFANIKLESETSILDSQWQRLIMRVTEFSTKAKAIETAYAQNPTVIACKSEKGSEKVGDFFTFSCSSAIEACENAWNKTRLLNESYTQELESMNESMESEKSTLSPGLVNRAAKVKAIASVRNSETAILSPTSNPWRETSQILSDCDGAIAKQVSSVGKSLE